MEPSLPIPVPPNAPAGPTLQTPSYSVPLSVPTPTAHPSGKWDCDVCQRAFFARERIDHLAGKAHRKRQVVWDAAESKRVLADAFATRAQSSANGSAGAQGPAAPLLWECMVCERSMAGSQKESHLQGRPHSIEHAKWEAEREKEKMVEEEERQKNEEKQENLRMAQDIWIEEGRRREEEEEELRQTEILRIAVEKQEELRQTEILRIAAEKQENEEKLKEMRRASQMWIEEETRKKEARKMVEVQELRIAENIRVQEENRKMQEQEQENLRNAQEILFEQIQIEQIRAEEEKRKNEEELRRTEEIRIGEENRKSQEEEEENLRKAREVQLQLARIEEEKQRRVEEIRIAEEYHSNAVKKAKLDLQNAASAEGQLRIEQVKQRKMWIKNEEQAAAAAWKMEEQLRMEQDDRRKEWMKKQEEAASMAWQKEEQLRIEEEDRRMECIRNQEEQAAVAWRMVEQVRIQQQDRRKEWMRKQDQQAVAGWRMEEILRIEEEILKKEWMAKQEEAVAVSWRVGELLRLDQEKYRKESQKKLEEAAAELTRAELLRKQSEEEVLRKQELERTQARLEQVQLEIQKEQEQQQAVDRVAREELVQNTGGQSRVVQNRSSPGISIDTMGWFQSGIPSIQIAHQGTGQEMQQQVWMPPHIVMTFPLPIRSVTDMPPILYRVYDETSVSKYSWEGFTAAASCMPQHAFHFRDMVNLHGNWSSRESTPFISVTDSPISAAWHIEIRQATRGQSNIMVALIDTAALLGQTSVWKMHDARDHFGLQPWKCHRRAFDNEYICALRIPARAIVACCRPGYFKQNAQMFMDGLGGADGTDTSGERSL